MRAGDFPGGQVVKNPRSNARDMVPFPGWGTKISHAARQLSLDVVTPEPMCSKLRDTTREKPPSFSEEPTCLS